ncbi:thioredoxin family protein [bacterium]|nr:thioredoxin family protein [bacterium]
MQVFQDVTEYDVRVYCDDCAIETDSFCRAIQECVDELNLNARVTHHTQMVERVRAGIPLSPAFSVNGAVLAMGRSLSKDTIRALIKTASERSSGSESPGMQL